jgi:hypothetical protein
MDVPKNSERKEKWQATLVGVWVCCCGWVCGCVVGGLMEGGLADSRA